MRGRTNIPNRKDPIINGDVENFVVAANNVITKGDFVSVVRNGDYRVLDELQYTVLYKKLYDVVNKKMVVVAKSSGGVFYAFLLKQNSSGSVEIIDSISLDTQNAVKCFFDFNVSTNSLYYKLNVPSGHSDYRNIHKYSIVNDEFVVQPNLVVPYTGNAPTGFAVFGVEENIAFTHSSNYSYFVVYSVVNNQYQKVVTDISIPKNAQYVMSGDNCVIVIGEANNSGSIIYKFYNFSLTGSTGTISQTTLNFSNSINSAQTHDMQIVGNTLYLLINVQSNASSGSGSYWYRPIVGIFDLSENPMTVKFYNEFTTVTPSWCYWWIDYGDANNVIVHSVSRYETATYGYGVTGMIVLTKNEQDIFSFIVGEFQNITLTQNGVVGFMNDGEIKSVAFTSDYSSSTGTVSSKGVVEYSFLVDENEILFGQPTNFVKAYDGKGSIGFAKTDGVAGDTVQIYVPHNNS